MKNMPCERGNALWMILIVIALLGGVTAMFTRTSSTSEDTGKYENLTIQASKTLRYAASLEQGVQSLMMRGCSENQLSFWYDSNGDNIENGSDTFYNPNSPTDRSCHLFYPEGAGLSRQSETNLNATTVYIGAHTDIKDIGVFNCGNSSCSELYVAIHYDHDVNKQGLCDQLNRVAGNTDLVPAPNTAAVYFPSNFNGTFPNYAYISSANFAGKKTACYKYSSDPQGNAFIFYYVLLAR